MIENNQIGEPLRYLSLARLMGACAEPVDRHLTIDLLEHRLLDEYKKELIEEVDISQLQAEFRRSKSKNVLMALRLISQNLKFMRWLNVTHLVIDVRMILRSQERSEVLDLIRYIWTNGCEIYLLINKEYAVSFDGISEMVVGNSFIDVYINSIVKTARAVVKAPTKSTCASYDRRTLEAALS